MTSKQPKFPSVDVAVGFTADHQLSKSAQEEHRLMRPRKEDRFNVWFHPSKQLLDAHICIQVPIIGEWEPLRTHIYWNPTDTDFSDDLLPLCFIGGKPVIRGAEPDGLIKCLKLYNEADWPAQYTGESIPLEGGCFGNIHLKHLGSGRWQVSRNGEVLGIFTDPNKALRNKEKIKKTFAEKGWVTITGPNHTPLSPEEFWGRAHCKEHYGALMGLFRANQEQQRILDEQKKISTRLANLTGELANNTGRIMTAQKLVGIYS